MGFLKEFLKLTRFEHALMLAVGVLIGELIVLGELPALNQILLLSLLVPVLSEMGSFSLNDYLDIKTDRANKRNERPLVKGTISPQFAFYFSWFSFILSIVFAYLINFNALIIAIIFNLLAVLYNYKLKDLPLVGNAFIAFSMAIPFVFGNFVYSNTLNNFAIFLAVIAFISGLGREIVKSVQDMEGDKKERKSKTLPLVIGKEKSLFFAGVLFLLFVLCIGALILYLEGALSKLLILIVLLLMFELVMGLLKGNQEKEFLEKVRKNTLIAFTIGMLSLLSSLLL
jgi:geranylgeranylglycerol-phosphate geranylgeranyltransferase